MLLTIFFMLLIIFTNIGLVFFEKGVAVLKSTLRYTFQKMLLRYIPRRMNSKARPFPKVRKRG